MTVLRALGIEFKATSRIMGVWLPLACFAWCAATWLQEPLFLRSYGIDLLWDGGQAFALMALSAAGLAWCIGRSQVPDWSRVYRRCPWMACITGAVGLVAYGLLLCMVILATSLTLDSISDQLPRWGRLQDWFEGWGSRALPMCFLAPGIASLRVSTVSIAILWCGASGLCLAATWPTALAVSIATAGSLLLSAGLIRSSR